MTDQTTRETSPTCPECGSDAVIGPLGYRRELHCQSCWHYFQPTPTVEGSGRTEPESANDRFERLADAFHTDTGLMAPGKDVSAAMGADNYEARVAAWRAWQRGRTYGLEEAREKLEALAPSPTAARGVTGLPTMDEMDELVHAVRETEFACGEYDFDADNARKYQELLDEATRARDTLEEAIRTLLSAAEQAETAGRGEVMCAACLHPVRWADIGAANAEIAKLRSAAEQGERDREDAELLAWVEAQEGDVEADLLPAGLPVASEAWHEVAIRWKQDGALPALPLRDVLRAARQPRQEGDR